MSSAPRIYFSVGDPSGDIHGANLIEELKRTESQIHCEGFGGDLMKEAGCEMHYPLCDLAVIGFRAVLKHISTFKQLLKQTDERFRRDRPDALILIDYPGFNWHMARIAKKHKVPVFFFIPPQMWAWGGWRARKMRRLVDHVLSVLPFERDWYQTRHISCDFVGHPFFDELRQFSPDLSFLEEQQRKPGTLIGLLPGSRRQEIARNLETIIQTATLIHAQHPSARFAFACLKPEHATTVQEQIQKSSAGHLPIEVCVGKTSEIIDLAHSCVSVSGSVSLELLYRLTPTTILYRISRLEAFFARFLMSARYITLVNMLAKRELFPEYYGTKLDAQILSNHVLHWLENPSEHDKVRESLRLLRDEVAIPGACGRAAEVILDKLRQRNGLRLVA